MTDWYSRAREEDGRTDEEVMTEIKYRRANPPLGTGSDDSVRVLVKTSSPKTDMTDTEAGTPLTAQQLVPFLLSVIASGERLTADEVATIRALDAARSRPATDPAGLDVAIEKAIAIGCIRMNWGAARPCDEYDDGRELCGICALRVARLSVADGPGPEERCPCIADAELAAGPVCPSCGHRDHGRNGCRAALPVHREEPSR